MAMGLGWGCAGFLIAVYIKRDWWERQIWKTYGKTWDDGTKYLDPYGLYMQGSVYAGIYFTITLMLSNLIGCTSVKGQRKTAALACAANPVSVGFTGLLYYHCAAIDQESFFPLDGCKERHNGLRKDLVKEIFSSGLGKRALKLLWKCIQVALISFTLLSNMVHLPPRDPTMPLNQARYYVAFFEVTVLAFLYLSLAWSFLIGCIRYRDKSSPRGIATCLEKLSEWSALQLLRNLNFVTVAKRVIAELDRSKVEGCPAVGYIKAGQQAMMALVVGLAGIPVMAVKLTQLDFVENVLFYDYSLSQILRIVGFAISTASIYDIGDLEKLAVQRFLMTDYEAALTVADTFNPPGPKWIAWNKHLAKVLSEELGALSSFLVMLTFDAADLRRLLIHQDWNLPPKLYHDLLVEDRPILGERADVNPSFNEENVKKRRELVRQYFSDMVQDYTSLVSQDA
jgi:hypothetical protein